MSVVPSTSSPTDVGEELGTLGNGALACPLCQLSTQSHEVRLKANEDLILNLPRTTYIDRVPPNIESVTFFCIEYLRSHRRGQI